MITIEKFKTILRKTGSLDSEGEEEINQCWESAVQAACSANAKMPGIGFFSVAKRMNCFLTVCRELDAQIQRGEITLRESQLALLILRTSNSAFNKAMTMFDIRGSRLRASDKSELPNAAYEYLIGLEYTSRR
jgi:hypothetical protein